MYVESKNYQELYELVKQDNRLLCEVDYKFSNDRTVRDNCVCKMVGKNISFSVRGLQYGGVDDWEVTEFGKSERDLFVDECVRMKVVWFKA